MHYTPPEFSIHGKVREVMGHGLSNYATFGRLQEGKEKKRERDQRSPSSHKVHLSKTSAEKVQALPVPFVSPSFRH